MQNILKYKGFIFLSALIALSGCRKIFDLPEEKSYLSTKATYNTKEFPVILGRTNLIRGAFNPDNSTFPITFELINPRYGDGRPADELLTKRNVLVWTSEYTGLETSLQEIESKRKLEERPLLEVRPSGDILMWYTATSDIVTPRDSVVLPQDMRYFDVKVSNSGGKLTIKDLAIVPSIERPYFPDEDINPITGEPNTVSVRDLNRKYNAPYLFNMTGESTNQPMDNVKDANRGIVRTYFRKFEGGTGNSLRFVFLDKDSLPIDPAKFNETRWDQLVHGFNKQTTDTYVQYDVAYPIPVAPIPTRFTSGGVNGSGSTAHVEFLYSRMGFGGTRILGGFGQDFAIYEKGDWEIVFHFVTVNPKFENE